MSSTCPNLGIVCWPDDWPQYKQICYGSWDSCCDALVGPCRCGAWHQEGEFELKDGKLYRRGEDVTNCTRPRQRRTA